MYFNKNLKPGMHYIALSFNNQGYLVSLVIIVNVIEQNSSGAKSERMRAHSRHSEIVFIYIFSLLDNIEIGCS